MHHIFDVCEVDHSYAHMLFGHEQMRTWASLLVHLIAG